MQFLEAAQTIEQDAAMVRQSVSISGPDGIGSYDVGGYRNLNHLRRAKDPRYMHALIECAKLMRDVHKGDKPSWYLREAMTTSDFPLLFGDNLYRALLGNYTIWPTTYQEYADVGEVRDFRLHNLYTIDGGTGFLPKVGERGEYPETKFTEGRYQLQVAKYGERFGISLEMVVNDDLNAFTNRVKYLAQGAKLTEEYLVTQQFVDVNGPHASFYTTGNKNIVTGNPTLSIDGLQTAMQILAAQTNSDGQPIIIRSTILVVPPALEIIAMNILNSTELRLTGAGGGTTSQLITSNWMTGRVKLVVNPFIPIVASTANGSTSWFLFADPNNNQRPALAARFLQGRRQPQMFIKDPNARMIGGGTVDPLEGDFDTDAVDYKLRHFFGSSRIDPKATIASKGSGS